MSIECLMFSTSWEQKNWSYVFFTKDEICSSWQRGQITVSTTEQCLWSQEKSEANTVLLKDTSAGWTRAVRRRKLWAAGSEMSRERLLIIWRPLSSKAVSMLSCLWAKRWVCIFSKNIILLFLTSHLSGGDSITELSLQHSHFAQNLLFISDILPGRAVTFY